MKASKLLRLKQKWSQTADALVEAVKVTVDTVTETAKEEVIAPAEKVVQQVKKAVEEAKPAEAKKAKDEEPTK